MIFLKSKISLSQKKSKTQKISAKFMNLNSNKKSKDQANSLSLIVTFNNKS